jgi:serine/threonine protein kinase
MRDQTQMLPPGDDPPLQPRRIDRYELRERIGRGGMGTVYRAVDTKLGRTVALKTATTTLAAARLTDRVRQRFLREAMALSQVTHRNVVQVLDFGFADDGTPFLVMEHLPGRDLGALLLETSSPLPVPRAVDIMLGVCAALRACHRVGIIHRDLKPENIFLAETDTGPEVKVLDFGVSKTPSADDLTREGQILGTPQFLAPEQIDGKVGPASDQYALGVMMYVCLTRHLPYEDHEDRGLLRAIEAGRFLPPRTRRSDVPEALEKIILRAMQVAPADRFESVHALGRKLWELASPRAKEEWRRYYFPEAAPAPVPAFAAVTRTQILEVSTADDKAGAGASSGARTLSHPPAVGDSSFESDLRPARTRRWPWVSIVLATALATIGAGRNARRRAAVPANARASALAPEAPPEIWAPLPLVRSPPAATRAPAVRSPKPWPGAPNPERELSPPQTRIAPVQAPLRRRGPRRALATAADAPSSAPLPNIDRSGIGIPSE